MFKLIIPITCLLLSVSFKAEAQLFSKGGLESIIEKELNRRVSDLLGIKGKSNGFNFKKLKIRNGDIVFKSRLTLKDNKKPYRLKGRFALSLKNPKLTALKVHVPGDNFLFFPKYESLLNKN